MPQFNEVLPVVAGVLATKQIVCSLLAIRARLIGNDFATGRPNAEVLPEDKKLPAFVANFFKVLLVAGGPTPSIDRLNAVISNSAENEPFLVGLAAALAVSGSAPSWGSSALLAYTAFRIFHAISYLAAIRQPARAVAWVGGSVACLSLAAVALAGIFKK